MRQAVPSTPEPSSDGKRYSAASGEHLLETPWSIWYDRKPGVNGTTFGNGMLSNELSFQESSKAPTSNESVLAEAVHAGSTTENEQQYVSHLVEIGTCDTVEEFWSFYTHLVRPYDLPKHTNVHFFRNRIPPTWESYPNGGAWIFKIKKDSGMLARLWEKLLFSIVGESIDEPDIVGVVLSIRQKEDVISVWNADASLRFRVSDKLKRTLRLGNNALVEYKTNAAALSDHSSFRNANKFFVQREEGIMSPPPTPPISIVPPEQKEKKLAEIRAAMASQSNQPLIAQPRPKKGNSKDIDLERSAPSVH